MDSAAAHKLVTDWGRAERSTGNVLQEGTNGAFFAHVASLGFRYDPQLQVLAVYGQVLPDTQFLSEYQDVQDELARIAREEPERVYFARFELVKMPYDADDPNPTLFLRRDYKSAGDEKAIFAEWKKLRETAYLWHRTYFGQAVEPVVQRRKKP